ncbi:Rv3654c family TadE-like protein [Yinghuangia aomiensis]
MVATNEGGKISFRVEAVIPCRDLCPGCGSPCPTPRLPPRRRRRRDPPAAGPRLRDRVAGGVVAAAGARGHGRAGHGRCRGDRHRAAAASDAAALAAAARLDEGASQACAVAADVAARQGAKLTACVINGEFVDVVAEFPPPPMLAPFGAPCVAARAGPAWTRPRHDPGPPDPFGGELVIDAQNVRSCRAPPEAPAHTSRRAPG